MGVEQTPVELVGVPSRHRRHTALVISAAVGVLFIVVMLVLITRAPAKNRQADSPLIGRAAPLIQGTTIDGNLLDLDAYRGRWVVVNYFATWCIPCREEHPELMSFNRRHQQIGDAALVMVIYNDSVDEVRKWFADNGGGDWPVINDPNGRTAIDYGVAGPPESYIIDPTGTVRAKLVGGVTSIGLDRVLANLSNETTRSNR